MSNVDIKLINSVLAQHNIVVDETTPVSVKHMAFNILYSPDDKDIISYSGHDLDGDVGYVFTFGENRYIFPGKTTVILLNALKYVPTGRECALLF